MSGEGHPLRALGSHLVGQLAGGATVSREGHPLEALGSHLVGQLAGGATVGVLGSHLAAARLEGTHVDLVAILLGVEAMSLREQLGSGHLLRKRGWGHTQRQVGARGGDPLGHVHLPPRKPEDVRCTHAEGGRSQRGPASLLRRSSGLAVRGEGQAQQ